MIAFVHIPKTAGTTLHKILSHQYSRTFIHHDATGAIDQSLAARVMQSDAQVMMGHFSVGIHAFIPNVRYISCLREPVARIISHYQHAQNDPTHYLHHAITSDKLDLAGYVTSGLSGELSNGMTRMLAGMQDFHHDIADEDTLERAKSNIATYFDGVLLSESFDSNLLMLADHFHWPTPYYIRRKVGNYRSFNKVDDRTRDVIRETNHLDCELYAWVKQRIIETQSQHPDLAQRTQQFQHANQRQGKIIFCLRELRMRVLH